MLVASASLTVALLGACDVDAPPMSAPALDPTLLEAVQGTSSPDDPRLPMSASKVEMAPGVPAGAHAVDVGEEVHVPVRVRWRIPGVDSDDRAATDVVTVRREPDGWTRRSPVLLPWGVEDPVAETSARCRVVGPAAVTGLVTAVHAACERSVPAVSDVWPHWHGAAVVVVTTSDDFAPGMGARVEGVVSDGRPAPADRMIVDGEVVRQLSDAGLDVLMRHELVHVAMRATGSAPVPIWVQEGLAEYVGYAGVTDGRSEQPVEMRRLHELRETGMWRGTVPGAAQFEDPLDRGPAYVAARLGVEVLMDAVGRDRLLTTIAGNGVGDAGPSGSAARPTTDAARTHWLLTELDRSPEWLDDEWAKELDRRVVVAQPSP